MKTIHKFPLNFSFKTSDTVLMPAHAKILCVQMQNDVPTLWAEVSSANKTVPRHFLSMGTGWVIEEGAESMTYIGTVQAGIFVWHVYELLGG